MVNSSSLLSLIFPDYHPFVPEIPEIIQEFAHFEKKACGLSLPRRVFIPWLAGTFVCDYLQPSETFEVCGSDLIATSAYTKIKEKHHYALYKVLKDRCVELLSMEVPTDASKILEPEREAPSAVTKSFWDVAVPLSTASSSCLERGGLDASRGESSQKSTDTTDAKITPNIIAAAVFLIVAIILGYILVSVKS